MTTISLAGLIAARNESLRARPVPLPARLLFKVRRINVRPVFRALMLVFVLTVRFTARHGLVLAACSALVVGAATLSATAAWITTAGALFFLEARRR